MAIKFPFCLQFGASSDRIDSPFKYGKADLFQQPNENRRNSLEKIKDFVVALSLSLLTFTDLDI